MAVTAHVPGPFESRPQKDGTTFTYGDYDVSLETCETCGGVYAVQAGLQHRETAFHKSPRGE